MLFPLRSQFLKYDLSYFFYSGKAGKGWRKCWLSTILNTTRLLSLQTGARHALSVNTFDILSSFFITSPHQLCQARCRHGKTKWKGKSRKMTETSQDALLIPWTWPTLKSATTSSLSPAATATTAALLLLLLLQWEPLRRLSDMQRPGHGRLISSCSFNGIKGGLGFWIFQIF